MDSLEQFAARVKTMDWDDTEKALADIKLLRSMVYPANEQAEALLKAYDECNGMLRDRRYEIVRQRGKLAKKLSQ